MEGMAPALDRLQTISWSAAVLSVTAAADVIAWTWRAATSGSPDAAGFAAWQRPLVDGPSRTSLPITLAGIVLVVLLPPATRFAKTQRFTTIVLAAAAFANVVIGIGYLATSNWYHDGHNFLWARPSLPRILLDQVPNWGVAVVTAFVVASALGRTRTGARDNVQPPA